MTPTNINIPLLLTQLDWNESDDLEFKSAKGGLPKSLWETYSSMANSQGGIILLGVEDDGRVSGVSDVERLLKSFWDTVHNRGKVSLNLLMEQDVIKIPYEDKSVLAIRVPRASRTQRPIFLGQNPLLGSYRRNSDGDYHCTELEVGRMLADRSEEPADHRILHTYTLDDLDKPSLQQYRQRFASLKPTHPWLNEDDKGLLSKLGGWRRDRDNGNEGLTIAGMLMFGKQEALRYSLPQYHVDYREKLSDSPNVRWTDRFTLDGTWAGNLFQFYLRAIQRLAVDLKIPFKLEANLFRKDDTPVHEAIREALVNALIHADYQGLGGIIIEKHSNYFEFSNPGNLLISIEQLLRGSVSECRNKSLQTMFLLIGAGEKAGSGVDKIHRGWESQHWRTPKVTEQVQPTRVVWMLPMMSLVPDESIARLQKRFGKDWELFSSVEIQALITADLEGGVDNTRMRQVTARHATDITALLQGLVAKQALRQIGKGRWTRYRLQMDAHVAGHSVHNADHSVHNEDHSVHNAGHSVHNEDHSVHNADHSVHNEDHSVHNADHSVHNEGHSVHNEDVSKKRWEELKEMAAPAFQSSRLLPKEMERIILALCQGDWLTRRELGKLLNRNPDGIRSRFLTPLVEHGLLRLRYPNTPNRTDQAYRAKGEV